MPELKGLQVRVEHFWKDDQGRVVFSVAGEPLPFVVDSASVDASLIPYLAIDLGVTMNYEVLSQHNLVKWWSFVRSPMKDEYGQSVPWASRRIRYRKLPLPLAKKQK